jgi:hypothetical protein
LWNLRENIDEEKKRRLFRAAFIDFPPASAHLGGIF